ncbi:MAG TPA: DUF1259 domain-containing protein [Candidatus Acidoferrales bacterium]|nr:DUF1259 domain-containing protein [Candidatus Acidoferrales bacterium]
MKVARFFVTVVFVFAFSTVVSSQGLTTTNIDQVLGRSGQKTGDVYKVGFPRTDLHVVADGVVIKPAFALGSWAAFSGSDNDAKVMGDLVLLQDEINPVMQKLRAAGFEITAVHNHLLDETPRVMYMHYMGRGPATQLASSLRGALAVSKTPLAKPTAPSAASAPPAWVNTVNSTLGRNGMLNGGVLAFGVPRKDSIMMDGIELTPAQGVAESINFQDASAGKVATTGDFVLTAAEVNPVISALEQHGLSVMALHSHMLNERPRLFFMHFWGVGTPDAIAAGIKAALAQVSTK